MAFFNHIVESTLVLKRPLKRGSHFQHLKGFPVGSFYYTHIYVNLMKH